MITDYELGGWKEILEGEDSGVPNYALMQKDFLRAIDDLIRLRACVRADGHNPLIKVEEV